MHAPPLLLLYTRGKLARLVRASTPRRWTFIRRACLVGVESNVLVASTGLDERRSSSVAGNHRAVVAAVHLVRPAAQVRRRPTGSWNRAGNGPDGVTCSRRHTLVRGMPANSSRVVHLLRTIVERPRDDGRTAA